MIKLNSRQMILKAQKIMSLGLGWSNNNNQNNSKILHSVSAQETLVVMSQLSPMHSKKLEDRIRKKRDTGQVSPKESSQKLPHDTIYDVPLNLWPHIAAREPGECRFDFSRSS